MNFEITGRLVEKYDTRQATESFRVREFVVEQERNINGNTITDFIKFQVTQDRCATLDNYPVNSTLKVLFNIRGKKYERDGMANYFNSLEAWRIEFAAPNAAGSSAPAYKADPVNVSQNYAPQEESDDLPF